MFREEGQVLTQIWGRKREGEAALLTSGCLTDLSNKVHLYRGVQCSCRKNKVFLNVLAGEKERSPGYIVELKKRKRRTVFEYTSICEERGENKIIYLFIVLFAQGILQ